MNQSLDQILLDCSRQLDEDDLDSLKLLCKDDILASGKLDNISTRNSLEIFKLLKKTGHISSNNLAWLHDTLKHVNVQLAELIPYDEQSEANATGITPYRLFLLQVARHLSPDDIKSIKFLLPIAGWMANEIINGQRLILHMEKLFETPQKILHKLKGALASIKRNDLKSIIENFEKTQGVPAKVAQESNDNQTAPLSARLGTTSDTNNAEANHEHGDSAMNNGRSTMVDESATGPSGSRSSMVDKTDAGPSEIMQRKYKTMVMETGGPTLSSGNTLSDQNNPKESDEEKPSNSDRSTSDQPDAGSSENENKAETRDMETRTVVVPTGPQETCVDDDSAASAVNGSNQLSDGKLNTKEDSEATAKSDYSVDLKNIHAFEKELISYFKEKVKKYEDNARRPGTGKKTDTANIAGQSFSCVVGVTAVVVGATVSATVATMGVAGPVVLGTLLVAGKIVRVYRREKCQRSLKPMEEMAQSVLECIVEKTAKELSRIFEFQISMLKGNDSVKKVAKAAVDLMVDLKEEETFDVNTLLKKVLDSKGSTTKENLTVKSIVPSKTWMVPSIFWETGLRKWQPVTKQFLYWDKANCSRAEKYGFRGELLIGDNADIDKKFKTRSDPCLGNEGGRCKDKDCKHVPEDFFDYKPYHCLVLRYEDLKRFSKADHTATTFADFVRAEYGYPENQSVKPVFRPLESMTGTLNLNTANFEESDLSGANFAGFQLDGCDFTKCVVLSGDFEGASMKGARFQSAYLFDCILDGAKAQECFWSQADLYHCQVYRTDFRKPKDQLGCKPWHGTDLTTAIQNDEDLERKV